MHGVGRVGGGVHSNINSFLAKGAPVNFLMTISNTPLLGLFADVTFTGPCSSPEEANTHLGPRQGSLPCTGHVSLGPIFMCDTVTIISPFDTPNEGQGFCALSSLIVTLFDVPDTGFVEICDFDLAIET